MKFPINTNFLSNLIKNVREGKYSLLFTYSLQHVDRLLEVFFEIFLEAQLSGILKV